MILQFQNYFINIIKQQSRQNQLSSEHQVLSMNRSQVRNSKQKQQKNTNNPAQEIQKQLRILDYRNGKYQGFTSRDSLIRNGLGILIDDNYSFVLSQWTNNKVQGPFFMVYPDQSILYGFIENQKIGQIVSYEVNKQFTMILSKNTSTIIVDLLPSSSILVFKVDKKLLDEHSVQSILAIEQQKQKNDQISKGISLTSEERYANRQQKYKIYQKRLSVSNIADNLKSHELFIKQKILSTEQKKDLIELVKTKQDLTVNFKKSALSLFLKLQTQTNQTKMLGSINRYENEYEFYRKFIHSSNSVQQAVTKSKDPFVLEYNLRPSIRPKKCEAELSKFHRSSVTYLNDFINLSSMYVIKSYLGKINKLINIYVTNKFAQVQLQNTISLKSDQNPKQKRPQLSKDYSLLEVQQQIYEAVKRRRLSTGKKTHTAKSSGQSLLHHKSIEEIAKSKNKNADSAFKNINSPYVKSLLRQDDLHQSRLNRSKTYLNVSTITKNYDIRATPASRIDHTQAKSKNAGSGKKYSYLDDTQNFQNQKINLSKNIKTPGKYDKKVLKYDGTHNKYDGLQNIRMLTEDYENIQNQIKLSTPKGKSGRSPYKLDNSAYQNSTRKSTQYDIHNPQTASKYTPLIHIGNHPSSNPLSQKKFFKYLPI